MSDTSAEIEQRFRAILRRLLFLRSYGGEFDPQTRDRILRALDAESPPAHATPPRQHHS